MANYQVGDLVVLKSGSMRMCVEGAEDGTVSVVWCHEGIIGRDSFDEKLLNKWEHREERDHAPRDHAPRDHAPREHAPRDQDRGDGPRAKPYGDGPRKPYGDGPRKPYAGGSKPFGGPRSGERGDAPRRPYGGGAGGEQGDRPRKTGWDGKPREKKYFRKDG